MTRTLLTRFATRQLLVLVSVTALIALPLLAGAQSTVRPDRVGMSAERLNRISDFANRALEDAQFAGAVTLVARNGQIVHLQAHGYKDLEAGTPMRTDSIFRIASMSKPVGTVALMMLVEDGLVRLNDPISRFLPEYADMQVAMRREGGGMGPGAAAPPGSGAPGAAAAASFYTVPASRPIRVQDLLTHTSGVMSGQLSNSQGNAHSARRHDDGLAWIHGLAEAPLEFHPGDRWAYSALAGFDVISRIVEVVSDQTFDAFLRERVFAPLRMNDTFFWPNDAQRERLANSYVRSEGRLNPRPNPDSMSSPVYFSAAGGLMTTAADYARFAMMLANNGELDGARILSPRSVELIAAEFLPDSHPGRSAGEGFGLGVRVVSDPVAAGSALTAGSYGWSGFYGTHFWVDPEKNLVGILFAQTYFANSREDFEMAVMQAVIE
jgi:CubicO group peptidase (beta-lactamase class C family)